MKNKSKLKKIREKNHGAADAPKEWFYMQQKEITVRDIADALQEEADLELEIWEAAGVLEVVIPGRTLDGFRVDQGGISRRIQ